MTKNFLNLALASVLSCGIAFAADNYTTEGKEKITRNDVNIFLEPNSPNKQKYLNGKFDKALEKMKKTYEESKNNKAVRAPAPLVTQVLILDVCSSQMQQATGYDCEEIIDNQTSTGFDHGGNPFNVWTGVEGYGGHSYDSAKFSGNEAIQLTSEGVDFDGDNIVDGFIDNWDISKPANTSGTFEFKSISINNPAVYKSTSIYIK